MGYRSGVLTWKKRDLCSVERHHGQWVLEYTPILPPKVVNIPEILYKDPRDVSSSDEWVVEAMENEELTVINQINVIDCIGQPRNIEKSMRAAPTRKYTSLSPAGTKRRPQPSPEMGPPKALLSRPLVMPRHHN